jgi:UDP-N-acetylmuramoyl-L-alanyl-D-glutamate--2,6-diaminopimelate ligase
VKLSTLLNAVESANVNEIKVQGDRYEAPDKRHNDPALRPLPASHLPDADIGSIHYRAQEVKPGGLFVAVEGQAADGHDFVGQALERGAAAVVVQKEIDRFLINSIPAVGADTRPVVIRVSNTRIALADLAARFFNNPSKHMTLIGITGTNGKTTVAYLTERILQQAGFRVGVIGTINYHYSDKTFSNPMTTPESLDLQRILAEMRRNGVTHAVMEASSHAVDLYRIKNCWFNVAVFTNLSQDHLDFHGDMQSYWSSKKKLFTEYLDRGPKKETAVAVINCDDPRGRELAGILPMPIVKTGSASDCEIRAENFQCTLNGTTGKVAAPEGSFDFKTPLVGVHNVENILSAAGVGMALNIAPRTVRAGIEALNTIPGRLERIENTSGRFVYVDYAHTPDALKNAISALKEIAPARIICIFGCGGDRDKEKRPLMGEIVAGLCDLSIVTSDNPRTEDPLAIIKQILPGTRKKGGVAYSAQDLKGGFEKSGFAVEPDRRSAIELGVSVSRPGDAVLIAGKGHETYQIVGKDTIDFDDREEARKALRTVGDH